MTPRAALTDMIRDGREIYLCGESIAGAPKEIGRPTATEVITSEQQALPSPAHVLAYPDFVAALKNALRDCNRPDLLARNPLLRSHLFTMCESAGPAELRALLCETLDALFANARDEKLRRVIEFTYFWPAPKQEATAERLGLPFSTYRRHLAMALGRLARWLWERSRA